MELNVEERLMLLQLLPERGNLLTLRIVSDLKRELSFSEREFEVLGLRTEGGRVRWDAGRGTTKDIEVGRKASGLIRERLGELNEREELTVEHLSLCDKFGFDGT